MDSMLRIGPTIDKEATDNLKSFVETVFRVGFDTRMEQDTIQKALDMITTVCQANHVTISDNRFTHHEEKK